MPPNLDLSGLSLPTETGCPTPTCLAVHHLGQMSAKHSEIGIYPGLPHCPPLPFSHPSSGTTHESVLREEVQILRSVGAIAEVFHLHQGREFFS